MIWVCFRQAATTPWRIVFCKSAKSTWRPPDRRKWTWSGRRSSRLSAKRHFPSTTPLASSRPLHRALPSFRPDVAAGLDGKANGEAPDSKNRNQIVAVGTPLSASFPGAVMVSLFFPINPLMLLHVITVFINIHLFSVKVRIRCPQGRSTIK